MKWIDTYEIVDSLIDKHPEVDPKKILFTDLRNLISNLEDVSYTHLTLPTNREV